MEILFGHVALCSSSSELEIIKREDITAAVWDRKMGDDLKVAINSLKLILGRRKTEVTSTFYQNRPMAIELAKSSLTKNFFGHSGRLEDKRAAILAQDISGLAALFTVASNNSRPVANLEYVLKNRFGYFHIDGLRLRLITTYFGPGTEWLPNHVCDVDALKKGEVHYDFNGYKKELQRLKAGQVMIFKGRGTFCHPNLGLIHRKPTHSGSRLVLKIN